MYTHSTAITKTRCNQSSTKGCSFCKGERKLIQCQIFAQKSFSDGYSLYNAIIYVTTVQKNVTLLGIVFLKVSVMLLVVNKSTIFCYRARPSGNSTAINSCSDFGTAATNVTSFEQFFQQGSSASHSASVMTAVHSFNDYFNVIPVCVFTGNRSLKTYAFLDQGSTTIFV